MKRKQLRLIKEKRGSYLVEAAMTLPLFILSMVALALVIQIISICENVGYLTACQVKKADLHAYSKIQAVSLCKGLESDVEEACSQLTSFQVKEVRYLFQGENSYDLIGITTESDFQIKNPIGIHGKIQFTEKLLSRGFTGALQDASPLDAAAFQQGGSSQSVWIFPKYGIRYHREGCSVLEREQKKENRGQQLSEEDAKRKGFSSCQLCMGGLGTEEGAG